jgi:hypothetical protein
MITFKNGPAAGQKFRMERTPIFLRVTEEKGKFDALNLPEDKPRPDEKLYAYIALDYKGKIHVHASGGGGGWFPIIEYALVPKQPDDEIMRDTKKWRAWVDQAAKTYAAHIETLCNPQPK